MSTPTRPHFDENHHRWALDQAERLRAMARMRPNAPIDRELVAAAVEEEAELSGHRPQGGPCSRDQVLGGWSPDRHPG